MLPPRLRCSSTRGYSPTSYFSPLLCIYSEIFLLITEMNWLNWTLKYQDTSKISVQYMYIAHEYSCIVWCAVPLSLMFMHHGDTTGKRKKVGFVNIQRTWIFIFFETMVCHVFQFFLNYPLQYYINPNHCLANNLIPM